MQLGQDHLDARQLLLGMLVDGHAAAVVGHLERAVLVDGDFDLFAVPGERFVDTVVDNLVSEMIGPRRIRVHAGPAANGLKPAEDFNVLAAS